jgi:hypothetical protein
MSYPDAAWERAMTVQQVLLKALSGEISLVSGGGHPRRLGAHAAPVARAQRAARVRGLVDKRRHSPSRCVGSLRRRSGGGSASIESGIACPKTVPELLLLTGLELPLERKQMPQVVENVENECSG